MDKTKSERFEIDPTKNPAVLDTLTWDAPSLIRRLKAQPKEFWDKVQLALARGRSLPEAPGLKLYEPSKGHFENRTFILLEVEDGQNALVEFAPSGSQASLPNPLTRSELGQGVFACSHEVSASNLHKVYSKAAPEKMPRALPMTPRLGIGTRMSRSMWPGIWQAMRECSFSANAIQNSLRELNLLENIRDRKVGEKLYYPGIGFVPEGHTGSTFEGLWLCGVVEALKAGVAQPYGADADHIMVKRGRQGLERAKRVLSVARHYSFFTIDVSDVLDYYAFSGEAQDRGIIERRIGDKKIRDEVTAYYKHPLRIGSRTFHLTEIELSGLIGKYWTAMEAIDDLIPFIRNLRGSEPFDLELSIDEHPPEVHAFDCLTSELEMAFILSESRRRGNALSHIAPNLGVEKHVDYRYRDGLEGLETRTRALHQLASEEGIVLDCHSGDDLSGSTRQALKRATCGLIHFKVSPYPQTLFAEVLYEFDRELFNEWWKDTYEFARENAREGSEFAVECLRQFATERETPHPRGTLFRIYCYATVGKRDAKGNYIYRERFYSLSPEFQAEYTSRLKSYLCMLAHDLLP